MKRAKNETKQLIITAEQNGFTMVSNNITRNNKLSDGAIRLYIYLKSHNESFNLSIDSIANYLNKSRATIERNITELKENGFLVLTKKENQKNYYYELVNSPKLDRLKELSSDNLLNGMIEGYISIKDMISLLNKKIITQKIFDETMTKLKRIINTQWIKKPNED